MLTPPYDFGSRLLGAGPRFKRGVVQLAGITDGDRVLDLACGTGILSVIVKQLYPRSTVIGVDIDRRILEIARARIAKAGVTIELVCASAEQAGLDAASFDHRVIDSGLPSPAAAHQGGGRSGDDAVAPTGWGLPSGRPRASDPRARDFQRGTGRFNQVGVRGERLSHPSWVAIGGGDGSPRAKATSALGDGPVGVCRSRSQAPLTRTNMASN